MRRPLVGVATTVPAQIGASEPHCPAGPVPAGPAGNLATLNTGVGAHRSRRDESAHRSVWWWLAGNRVSVSAGGGGDAFEGVAEGIEVDTVEVIE
jgi:hypothetical protein